MIVLLVLHLVVGIGLLSASRRLASGGRQDVAFAIAAVPSAATVCWLAVVAPSVIDGDARTSHVSWIPSLGVDLDLRLDAFALLMLALVAGIGVLVIAYAWRYFSHPEPPDVRLLGLLVLFAGAMVGLVVADNLLILYGFWELTSVTSFLLIGNRHEDAAARSAALQALLVTGLGALAMLAGFIVIGQAAGTYRLSELLADPPGGTTVTVALLLILLGAFTKSAQVPFHTWLPGAMVAPTPVSTYLHSATMVKAGVYLVARFAPVYALTTDWWRPVVVSVGVATMIVGGVRALRRTDLKLLLADGTISQLGFMIAVFGWGTTATTVAGCTMLLAHGAFKATAFMVVGILDHEHGTRDIRHLPRPGAGWGPTMVAATVAAASMAGVPLLFGFVAKEADYTGFLEQGAGAGDCAGRHRRRLGADGGLQLALPRWGDGPPRPGCRRGTRRPSSAVDVRRAGARAQRRDGRARHRPAVARRARRGGDDVVDGGAAGSPPRGVARPQHRAPAVGRRPRRRRRPLRRAASRRSPAGARALGAVVAGRVLGARCAARTRSLIASPPSPSPGRCRSTPASSCSRPPSCPAPCC